MAAQQMSRWETIAHRIGLPAMDRPGSGILVLATWIDAIGSGLFFTFYLLYLNKIAGFSLGTAGLVLSITAGVALAFNPVAGSLVDKTGPKPMMLFSQILCAIGYGGLLFVEGSVPRLAIFAMIASIGDRIFWVGFPSLVAQIAPDHERDRWFAFLGMTREAGFGIGGLLAAAIVALLGDTGYRVLIGINGLSFALAAVLIWIRVPSPPAMHHESDHGGWRAVFRDRPVMKMALANTMAACGIMTGFLAWPVYVVDHLHLGEWVPGIMFAISTVVLASGQAIGLSIVSGWRRTRVYILAAIIWSVGAIFFALAQIVPTGALLIYVFFAVIVMTGGDVFQAPQTNGLPSALAPPALRGRYLAMFSFSWGLARTIAPEVVAALLWVGPTALWLGV
ncbi:MAG TPA: MFS transporter, partial [Thermomicrobiales bacterium]|nr:MFS transporter [Thermomicrobiales bacterium]